MAWGAPEWTVANAIAAFLATLATLVLAGVSYHQTRISVRRDRLRDYHDLAVNVYGPLQPYLSGLLDPAQFHSSTRLRALHRYEAQAKSWRQIRALHPGLAHTLPSDLQQTLDVMEDAKEKLGSLHSEVFRRAQQAFDRQARAILQSPALRAGTLTIELTGWPTQLGMRPGPLELWAHEWTVAQWVDANRRDEDEPWDAKLVSLGQALGGLSVVDAVCAATLTELNEDPVMKGARAQAVFVAEMARRSLKGVEHQLEQVPT